MNRAIGPDGNYISNAPEIPGRTLGIIGQRESLPSFTIGMGI